MQSAYMLWAKHVAPILWNSLSLNIHNADSLSCMYMFVKDISTGMGTCFNNSFVKGGESATLAESGAL